MLHLHFPATPDEARAEGDSARPAAYERGRGRRVLFVDDEEPLVNLAARLLTRCGYRVSV